MHNVHRGHDYLAGFNIIRSEASRIQDAINMLITNMCTHTRSSRSLLRFQVVKTGKHNVHSGHDYLPGFNIIRTQE
jgi:hypothetical protein